LPSRGAPRGVLLPIHSVSGKIFLVVIVYTV